MINDKSKENDINKDCLNSIQNNSNDKIDDDYCLVNETSKELNDDNKKDD